MSERPSRNQVPPARPLPSGIVVRSAEHADVASIEQLVLDVVREVYGNLFPETAPYRAGNWRGGLVAEIGGRIVGVVVSDEE